MDLTATLIISAMLLFFAWQMRLLIRAKLQRGQPAPDTSAVDGEIADSLKVYYFSAQHCGHCRQMTPMVERLQQRYNNLLSLALEQNLELARSFKLAGTPSFVVVRDAQIVTIKTGVVSESWLEQQLNGSAK